MTAQDYPVYFPYGATSAPYSPSRPHRGEDRCNLWGVPVVVAGVQIGLVGSTGTVYDNEGNLGTKEAAHLHIQEWQSTPGNTRKPRNSFKPGIVTAATSSADFGNYVTIECPDGWNTTYAHLSKINVKVGQVIGGNMLTNKNHLKVLFRQFIGREPRAAEYTKFIGKDAAETYEFLHKNRKDLPTYVEKVNSLTKAIKVKDVEIARLKAISGDTSEATLLGKALIKFLAAFGFKKG